MDECSTTELYTTELTLLLYIFNNSKVTAPVFSIDCYLCLKTTFYISHISGPVDYVSFY